jgi:hypothetical protein
VNSLDERCLVLYNVAQIADPFQQYPLSDEIASVEIFEQYELVNIISDP